jgi:hypothetical protein
MGDKKPASMLFFYLGVSLRKTPLKHYHTAIRGGKEQE